MRRFLWEARDFPVARTRAAEDENERMFEEQTFGLWGAWSPGSRNLVGFGGLWHFTPFARPGVAGRRGGRLWAGGYAGEIAQAQVMTVPVFDSLNMPVVRAHTDVGNSWWVHVCWRSWGSASCAASTVAGLATGVLRDAATRWLTIATKTLRCSFQQRTQRKPV